MLTAFLALAGIVAVGRPTAPGAAIADYLPQRPVTRLQADLGSGEAWQVNQGLLPAADAWAELDLLARRHLQPVTDGHWLTVDMLTPQVAHLSLDLQVAGDVVSLRTIAGIDRALSAEPGIPVLSPALLDGGSLTWSGTLALDGEDPSEATAEVTSAAAADLPGCVATTVTLDASTEVLIWCPDPTPGLVGWQSETGGPPSGFTAQTAAPPTIDDPIGLDETPTAELTGGTVEELYFFRSVADRQREQVAPNGSRAVWAADQLVIADTAGRITSWLPIDDDAGSYWSQLWRTQPGGSVRDMAAVGAVTIVGTTQREVIAYDRDGWELWRTALSDAVTQLAAKGGRVVVADASGAVTVLDARSGEVAWRTDGVTELLAVGGDPLRVVVGESSGVRVIDLGSGETTWSRRLDVDAVTAAVAGGTVAIVAGPWVIARDAETGAVRFVRSVAPDTWVGDADGALLLSEPRTAWLLDPGGTTLWRSTAPTPTPVAMAPGQVLAVQADGLELTGPGATALTWTAPDGAEQPEIIPLRGDHGILTLQLVDGYYRWWEYR